MNGSHSGPSRRPPRRTDVLEVSKWEGARRILDAALVMLFVYALSPEVSAQGRAASTPPPDLTRGGRVPPGAKHDWTLGATGARGWMYCDRLVTSDARQIAITSVEPASPAARVLAVGDVILGAGGRRFSHDARREFGEALTAAETSAKGGRLELIRWRGGKTKTVRLRLRVLGDYGDTAPFGCSKSQRILKRGCAALARRMEARDYRAAPIPRALNALALLASGERRYLPLVRREARWAADFTTDGFKTWHYGYLIILLAEYRLASRDPSVMAGLRRLAMEAAEGQSAVGSWGHRFALPDGRLGGYGMMNSPGIPLTIGLVLAREAGVRHPAIDRAIERSARLLRFYVGKGAVPYGDHHPWTLTHEDNGKCGMAAVLFNLLGDQEAAEFFSRMSVAAHGSERDTGHTGNFFNLLWAMPGIALSGSEATGAWMAAFGGWYFDLARRADGTFVHQGPPQDANDSYAGWDATGAYLIAYAMPLRKIALTGRRPSVIPRLDRVAAESLIADGEGWSNKDRNSAYDGMSREELLGRLTSWSPVVRERAGEAIARKNLRCVPALIQLLDSPRHEARLGACFALGRLGASAADAVPALRKTLNAKDLWLRVQAANALARIGKPAMSALPRLFDMLARGPSEQDPRGMEQRYLTFALFDRREGLLRRSLEGVDRNQLERAVTAALKNEDGRARSAVAAVLDRLSFDELAPILPALHEAVRESAPSGIMFADGIRMEGLRLFAKFRVFEGIDACVHYLRFQKKHGSERRVPEVLRILSSYGAHARRVIPQLKQIAAEFEKGEPRFPKKLSQKKARAVREAIGAIEASAERPVLITLAEAVRRAAAKNE